MAIITLTTDWGKAGYYAAAVKGPILSQLPDATIVDITHEIEPFNVREASFIMRNAFRHFPAGTIHIIAVDSIESDKNPHVVVKAYGQYFISTDNGIFSHILDGKIDDAVINDVVQDTGYFTFATRDRFVKVAVMLANGEPLSSIGPKREKLNDGGVFAPVVKPDSIEGHVIFIDHYENLITNISQETFDGIRQGRNFNIRVVGSLYDIDTISTSYCDVERLDPVALFGTHGFLELALRNANLASLWGVEIDTHVLINFY